MKKPQCTAAFLRFSYAPIDKMQKNGIILSCENRTISSVGQSSRLITGRSKVRALDGPPKKHFAYAKCFFRISRWAAFEGIRTQTIDHKCPHRFTVGTFMV